MKVKRGDIYWITKNPYRPTEGSVQSPGRPGIVVSNDANNACSNTFEIVYLTSKQKKALPTHCTINSAPKPSIALCEQVQTISDEQLQEYIAHCTEEEMAEIDRCITISLGLPEPDSGRERPVSDSPFFTDEEVNTMALTITRYEKELAAANARVELLKDMYNSLLVRTIE